jgi:hypothetical protein
MRWYRAVLVEVWPTLSGPPPMEQEVTSRISHLRVRVQLEESNVVVSALLAEFKAAFDAERGRRERADGKASTLLATVSISSSLALAVAGFKGGVVIVLLIFALLYFAAAAWHVLQAVKPSAYFTVGPEDFLKARYKDQTQVERHAAAEYGVCAIRNRAGTNTKLDKIHLAQRFIRNAVFALVLGATGVGIVVVFKAVTPGDSDQQVTAVVPTSPSRASAVLSGLPTPTAAAAEPSAPNAWASASTPDRGRIENDAENTQPPARTSKQVWPAATTRVPALVDSSASEAGLPTFRRKLDARKLDPSPPAHPSWNPGPASEHAPPVTPRLPGEW